MTQFNLVSETHFSFAQPTFLNLPQHTDEFPQISRLVQTRFQPDTSENDDFEVQKDELENNVEIENALISKLRMMIYSSIVTVLECDEY